MNIRSTIRHVLPRTCLLCGAAAANRALCEDCLADLPWLRQPTCPQCATPTPAGHVCGACLKQPPAFARTVAALAYTFPLDRLIPRLKYQGRLAIAPALGECLVHAVASSPRPDRLIAMPLHAKRIRERGFNHATEIARDVAKKLGIALDTSSCQRIRDTPPQMGLKHDARRRNVRGAFTCSEKVEGQRIALVDDVMTTGTSLDELAATLKRAGAREVTCWVVARTLPPGDISGAR
ncbi:MAG: phosphoribosyltransferase [Hydrogenophilales bacterium 17-61-9]|nr:MAG: phosphoribosyltransferase [Hydrogenophilales bacterium 17-61-9]